MKKVTALILCLALMICFAGCNKNTAETTVATTIPVETTVPTETTTEATTEATEPVAENPDVICVSFNTEDSSYTTEDGIQLVKVATPYLNLYAPDNSNVSKIVRNFTSFADTSDLEEDMKAYAIELYSPDQSWYPCQISQSYNVARIDSKVLSLDGVIETESHGAHPSHSLISVSYDLESGEVLTLSDILASEDGRDDLVELVLDSLSKMGEGVMLFDDYVEVVRKSLDAQESKSENWYLTDTGLVIYYSVYEIAPYAAGDFSFEYSYEQLAGILKEAYVPAPENVECSGELTVRLYNGPINDELGLLTAIYLSNDGSKVIFSADGVISNVRLEKGYWNGDGTMFYVTDTLCALNYLHNDASVLVQSMMQEKSTIRISYTTTDGDVSRYLVYSSEDAAFKLISGAEN